MNILNIVTVGYNEEKNLPKLFSSLKYIKSKINIRHIYVDQSSQDSSLEIAKENGCEIYIHENKGYADPDKKWAVEKLLHDEEWCLFLDCDEEISDKLSDEIIQHINENKYFVMRIKLKTYFLGDAYVMFQQIRLFKKKFVTLSEEIHNYIKTGTQVVKQLNYYIINKDSKDSEKNIYNHIQKINTYSDNELKKYKGIHKSKIIFYLCTKPILSFLHWYIINKLFLHGCSGYIVSINMAFYTFTIYSKLYENNISFR